MRIRDLPDLLAPFTDAWTMWRASCGGNHIFGCCWCATRRQRLTDDDIAAGLDMTVMRGTVEELHKALAEQARRGASRPGEGSAGPGIGGAKRVPGPAANGGDGT